MTIRSLRTIYQNENKENVANPFNLLHSGHTLDPITNWTKIQSKTIAKHSLCYLTTDVQWCISGHPHNYEEKLRGKEGRNAQIFHSLMLRRHSGPTNWASLAMSNMFKVIITTTF